MPAAAQTGNVDPFANKLPEGEGRITVLELCSGACHPADRFAMTRKTPDEWRKVVLQMVANGSQLFPEDINVITNYLANHFGKNAATGK